MTAVDIDVCVGTCCQLMGAGELLALLEELPETLNGVKFNIVFTTCMDEGDCTCQGCPKARVNGTVLRGATPESVRDAVMGIVKAAGSA